jgi:hypothetical protein
MVRTEMLGEMRVTSWTGCRAQLACLHYLLGDDDEPPRVTALCKACSKASLARLARREAKP